VIAVDILRSIVEEHKATFNPNETRDFIDVCLHEQQFGNGRNQDEFDASILLFHVVILWQVYFLPVDFRVTRTKFLKKFFEDW